MKSLDDFLTICPICNLPTNRSENGIECLNDVQNEVFHYQVMEDHYYYNNILNTEYREYTFTKKYRTVYCQDADAVSITQIFKRKTNLFMLDKIHYLGWDLISTIDNRIIITGNWEETIENILILL